MRFEIALSILCFVLTWLPSSGQPVQTSENIVRNPCLKGNPAWFENLYTHGIRVEADTLILSEEVRHLISDTDAQSAVFPDEYQWEDAITMMKAMDLKKAFWFLINLYPSDKALVMKTIITYDSLLKMDEALISSFYTYAMIDPHISNINQGKPEVLRPDLVEKKLSDLKEMVDYLEYYRQLN